MTPIFQLDTLRETHRRIYEMDACRAASTPTNPVPITTGLAIALIGDSWGEDTGHELATLRNTYGVASPGFNPLSFQTTPAGSGNYSFTADARHVLSSGWTGNITDARSAVGRSITASTADRTADVTSEITAPTCVLHYLRTPAGGNFRWRIALNPWTDISTAGPLGLATLPLTGVPSSGGYVVRFETTGGGPVTLSGVLLGGGAGIRVDRLHWSGWAAKNFADLDGPAWATALASIAPNLCIVQLGTNDVYQYSAEEFGGCIRTIVRRVQESLPGSDILLVGVPERAGSIVRPMADFRAELRYIAEFYGVAFVDLQPSFGPLPSRYAMGTALDYLNSTTNHPNARGYQLIGYVLNRIITRG